MSRSGIRWIILSLVLCSVGMATRVFADDVNFESPPVHPIELSPSSDYGGRSVASGVYFVRLQTADAVRVKRVTIVR